MNWLKRLLRKWLGVELEMLKQKKEAMELMRREAERAYNEANIDYIVMEQKMDALCNLLQIDITPDCVTGTGRALVAKARDKNILKRYRGKIDKALTVEEIINIQARTFARMRNLIKSFD